MAWNISERRTALGWTRIDLAMRSHVRVDDVIALEAKHYTLVSVSALALVLDALDAAEGPKREDDLGGLAAWEGI
jgi:transcriptional regulator with XRE-family HTH domain